MASVAEQMASNISLANFAKATELQKRLWFTLGALILFRLLSYVPMPGIDPAAMANLFQTQRGGVLDFFNTFSGGSLERMSIIALGVMPYITASIVVQLGATLYGPWQALKKEGETGRKKLNQYTRYLTVLLTTVQGYFIAVGLESMGAAQGISAVVDPGLLFRAAATYQERHADGDGRHPATFQVVYLTGWAPHESKQKALRPGSAQSRLADALDTTEITTGAKMRPQPH